MVYREKEEKELKSRGGGAWGREGTQLSLAAEHRHPLPPTRLPFPPYPFLVRPPLSCVHFWGPASHARKHTQLMTSFALL